MFNHLLAKDNKLTFEERILPTLIQYFEHIKQIESKIPSDYKNQILFEKLKVMYFFYSKGFKQLYYSNTGYTINRKLNLFLRIENTKKLMNFSSKEEELKFDENIIDFCNLVIQFQLFKSRYEKVNKPKNFKNFHIRVDKKEYETFTSILNHIDFIFYDKNTYFSDLMINRRIWYETAYGKEFSKYVFLTRKMSDNQYSIKPFLKSNQKYLQKKPITNKIFKEIQLACEIESNIAEYEMISHSCNKKVFSKQSNFGWLKASYEIINIEKAESKYRYDKKEIKKESLIDLALKMSLDSFYYHGNPSNLNKNLINLYSNIAYCSIQDNLDISTTEIDLVQSRNDINKLVTTLAYLSRSLIFNYKDLNRSHIDDLDIILNYSKYKHIFDKLLLEPFSEQAIISKIDLETIINHGFKDFDFIVNDDGLNFDINTPIYNLYNLYKDILLSSTDWFIDRTYHRSYLVAVLFDISIEDINRIADTKFPDNTIIDQILELINLPSEIKIKIKDEDIEITENYIEHHYNDDTSETSKLLEAFMMYSDHILSQLKTFITDIELKEENISFQQSKYFNLRNNSNSFNLTAYKKVIGSKFLHYMQDPDIIHTLDINKSFLNDAIISTSLNSLYYPENTMDILQHFFNLYSKIVFHIIKDKLEMIVDKKVLKKIYDDIKHTVVLLSFLSKSLIFNFKGANRSHINDLDIILNYSKYKNIFDKLFAGELASEQITISKEEFETIINHGFKDFAEIQEKLEFMTSISYMHKSNFIRYYHLLLEESDIFESVLYDNDSKLDAQNLFAMNDMIVNDTSPLFNTYNIYFKELLLKYDNYLVNGGYEDPILIGKRRNNKFISNMSNKSDYEYMVSLVHDSIPKSRRKLIAQENNIKGNKKRLKHIKAQNT